MPLLRKIFLAHVKLIIFGKNFKQFKWVESAFTRTNSIIERSSPTLSLELYLGLSVFPGPKKTNTLQIIKIVGQVVR